MVMKKIWLAIFLAGVLVPELVAGQNCPGQNCDSCASRGFCCSPYGYCGSGDQFCGRGCQEGPCVYPIPPRNNFDVSGLVTEAFFDSIIDQAPDSCEGKQFYTRAAFLEAIESYPAFGRVGTDDDSKREIAAFFAHVTHETGHFCYINEINRPSTYCQPSADCQCLSSDGYYGRGPLQLSWNYNYGSASFIVGVDILRNPNLVAEDRLLSFRASLWFWMYRAPHAYMVTGQGFGWTIRAINSIDCDGSPSNPRIRYYLDYCDRFGVSPGDNLTCSNNQGQAASL